MTDPLLDDKFAALAPREKEGLIISLTNLVVVDGHTPTMSKKLKRNGQGGSSVAGGRQRALERGQRKQQASQDRSVKNKTFFVAPIWLLLHQYACPQARDGEVLSSATASRCQRRCFHTWRSCSHAVAQNRDSALQHHQHQHQHRQQSST